MASTIMNLTTIVLVLCLVGSSMQLGTLWVNQIWGNSDTHYVNIEQVRIDDNTMYVDFVNQLGTAGVSVEQTIFQAGNVHVPVNLTVDQTGTVSGVLNANGGIYADDAVNGGYSFTVQDNTGVTTISGLLNANGGINVNQGRFTVSGTTGETIIDTAPLRPNGGIDSNYGQFTVNPNDGSVLTKGQLNVNQDIIVGTNVEEDRFVRRVPTTAAAGGNTFIRGQDGIFVGGNLDLVPGYAAIGTAHGQIIFGRPQNDNLVLSRATSLATGGQTIIAGQSSTTGAGGDLLVRAGSTTVSTSNGGNLYLVPGTSTQPGSNGDIILGGANDASTPEFDLTIRRPDAVTLNGGITTLQGQNGLAGNGGDLVLAAGNGAPTGAASPVGPFGGDLVLQPGVAVNQLGKIILGRSDNDELFVTRVASVADAGATYFKGQDSGLGQGGDVRIIAGDAATDPAANTATAPNQNGGDIHLVTGLAANAGTPGAIYWGVAQQALEIRRELGATGTPLGTDTSIYGQQSAIGRGGDLNLFSGVGPTGSGNLVIQTAPTAANQRAGTISIFASDTDTPNGKGGDVRIFAGNGIEGNGGVISLSAGSGTVGGNIILQAGAGGTTAGQVIVKSGATLFLVDSAPVIIDNGDLVLTRSATEQVRLSANPNSILTVNGNVVLKSRITQTITGDASSTVNLVAGLDTNSVDNFLTDVQNSLNAVIRALSPCGHGLFNVYDPVNNVVVSDGTAAFCNANLNKRRNLGATPFGGVDILDKNARARIACGTNSAAITQPLTPTARGNPNSPATTANGVAETAPPLSFLVNDPNQRKCLLYNDAISGPEYVAGTPQQATTQGVLAAGYIHDNAQDPQFY